MLIYLWSHWTYCFSSHTPANLQIFGRSVRSGFLSPLLYQLGGGWKRRGGFLLCVSGGEQNWSSFLPFSRFLSLDLEVPVCRIILLLMGGTAVAAAPPSLPPFPGWFWTTAAAYIRNDAYFSDWRVISLSFCVCVLFSVQTILEAVLESEGINPQNLVVVGFFFSSF